MCVPSLLAQQCDSRIWSGIAKFHHVTSDLTACGYSPAMDDTMYAALRPTDYDSERFCNTCLKVSSAKGSVVVKVMDKSGVHGLDLHKKVFAKLGDTLLGNVEVTWQITDCPQHGNIGYLYSADSYFAEKKIMVVNSKVTVAKLYFRYQNGTFKELKRAAGNPNDFFVLPWNDDINTGPYDFKVEDKFGNTIIDTNIVFEPNQMMVGTNQFKGCESETTFMNEYFYSFLDVKFANPLNTGDLISIDHNSNDLLTMALIGVDGKVYFQTNTSHDMLTINPANLISGVYILKISRANELLFVRKLLLK
jgi:expansin (peptidoglycan-binding protein)